MESSTSKTAANILIVIAILLIGASLITTFRNGSTKNAPITSLLPSNTLDTPPSNNQVTQDTTVTGVTAPATTTASTTEIITSTSSTQEASSTIINIKGLTEKNWTWTKTTIGSKITTPKKTTAFTITFNTDGTLTGTTDCNPYSGRYKIESNILSFDMFDFEKKFCDGAQEGDFMTALQEVKSFLVDTSNNLTLSTASGSMMFK